MSAGQRGFGAIMAIMLLVIMASLSAALLRIGTVEQLGSAQDVLAARAMVAARTGIEIGLYKTLSRTTPDDPWKDCSNLSTTLDLRTTTGFKVTVSCNSTPYNEDQLTGETGIRLFTITATACNTTATTCPDNALAQSPAYIERVRQITASAPR